MGGGRMNQDPSFRYDPVEREYQTRAWQNEEGELPAWAETVANSCKTLNKYLGPVSWPIILTVLLLSLAIAQTKEAFVEWWQDYKEMRRKQ